jgi:3-phenylpropionate/trans-cinnamate dioxygenase ferredoxin subunit
MEFATVATIDQITEGGSKAFSIGEHDVVVFKYQGSYYALRRWCTHMGGDLSKGEVQGKIVTCPRHGSQFDVTSGKSVRGPKIGFLRLSTGDEITYPVKVEQNSIMVGVSDKAMMP